MTEKPEELDQLLDASTDPMELDWDKIEQFFYELGWSKEQILEEE